MDRSTIVALENRPIPPQQAQKIAKDVLTWLANDGVTNVRAKDRDFIQSLSTQARFSEKQLAYVLGDDKGNTPKDFEAIATRYLGAMKSAVGTLPGKDEDAGRLNDKQKADIRQTPVGELEVQIDQRFEMLDGDLSKAMKDAWFVYARENYLARTGNEGDIDDE